MNKMYFITAVLMILFISCSSVKPSGNKWEDKVKMIKVGMKRGDVEKLFQNKFSVTMADLGGKEEGYLIHYWVDRDWKITLKYDYSGSNMFDEDRPFLSTNPENRVIEPGTLTKERDPINRDHEFYDRIKKQMKKDMEKASNK